MRVSLLVDSVSEPLMNRVVSAWVHLLAGFGPQLDAGAPVEGDGDRVRGARQHGPRAQRD